MTSVCVGASFITNSPEKVKCKVLSRGTLGAYEKDIERVKLLESNAGTRSPY